MWPVSSGRFTGVLWEPRRAGALPRPASGPLPREAGRVGPASLLSAEEQQCTAFPEFLTFLVSFPSAEGFQFEQRGRCLYLLHPHTRLLTCALEGDASGARGHLRTGGEREGNGGPTHQV